MHKFCFDTKQNFLYPIEIRDWANPSFDFFCRTNFGAENFNVKLNFPNQSSADGQNFFGILFSTL